MHKPRISHRVGALLVGAVVVTTSLVVIAEARAAAPACSGGILASDPANDDTYAGEAGTGLESSSADLTVIRTTLGTAAEVPGSAVFVAEVRDLGETSLWHFDLSLRMDLRTDTGRTIVVEARRSRVTGETAAIDDVTVDVTANFDDEANTITVNGPASALGSVETLALEAAETRYDSGAVLSPLADQATGDCVQVVDPEATPPEPASDLAVKALIIDTGVNGLHPEFGDDQIFGWWDFSGASDDATPQGETWQDRDGDGELQGDRDDPYDPDGHGSSTASMLAGLNEAPSKTPSACPGCAVAVAKVFNELDVAVDGEAGVLDGSTAEAIRWGVDTLDVDVISISLGSRAPLPRFLVEDVYAATTYAREHGVLVVFANGNGWENAGIPGQPGGFMNYGNSTNALSVGADGLDSFLVTTDPEVVAVFTVNAAGADGDDYQDISGTSFSAPFTAGVAARLIGEGRECGSPQDLGPDSIEQLIKYTARDRAEVAPTFEGYGVVDLATMQVALGVVCGGADLPSPEALNDFYVTNVSGTQRQISSSPIENPVPMIETPFEHVTGPLVLGTSLPSGPKDAEVFQLVLAPGQTLAAVAEGVGDNIEVFDFDMALFAGTGPEYTSARRLEESGNGGAVREELAWTNTSPLPTTVSLVVYGWAIGGEQPFTLSGLDPAATRVFDGYVVADNVVLATFAL